jgi:hypothetical protein
MFVFYKSQPLSHHTLQSVLLKLLKFPFMIVSRKELLN